MIQIKVGMEEKIRDSNEKTLLTKQNGGITILSDTEETEKTLINSSKIVWHIPYGLDIQ